MELSFVGNKFGLRRYIESFLPSCERCNDEGFIEKTEWVGEDISYPINIRCECQED